MLHPVLGFSTITLKTHSKGAEPSPRLDQITVNYPINRRPSFTFSNFHIFTLAHQHIDISTLTKLFTCSLPSPEIMGDSLFSQIVLVNA